MKVHLILAAAGKGSRLQQKQPKQFLKINGQNLIEKCLETFLKVDQIEHVRVLLPSEDVEKFSCKSPKVKAVRGGMNRAESIKNGIFALKDLASEEDCILVHDAARPFVSLEVISKVVSAVSQHKAAIPVVAVSDTLKLVEQNKISKTISREEVRAAQTPQGALLSCFLKAYAQKSVDLARVTDEAMLLENCGFSVFCVEGDSQNFKITTQNDWHYAQLMSEAKT